MRTLLKLAAGLAATVVVLGVGATLLAPLVFPDAPVPRRAAPALEDGRSAIFGHAFRVPWPLRVQFIEARCTDDEVVLFYAQREAPYRETRYGFARVGASASPASGGGHSWSWDALMAEEELAPFLARATPCA